MLSKNLVINLSTKGFRNSIRHASSTKLTSASSASAAIPKEDRTSKIGDKSEKIFKREDKYGAHN
jgi:hypothetical protein